MPARFVAKALVLLLTGLVVSTSSLGAASQTPVHSGRFGSPQIRAVYVRPPSELPAAVSVRVVVVLHGMGGSGEEMARSIIPHADRARWLVVAPSIAYGDWRDTTQLRDESPALAGWLASYLDGLAEATGLELQERVLLLGYSRGAQLAHRFALIYPERVRAVAALSAGTYTLPRVRMPREDKPVPFPYGVADLRQLTGHAMDRTRVDDVRFWLGVGAEDTNPQDVPRSWDPYLGNTRVQRARAFHAALQELGAHATLEIIPGAAHGLTPAMLDRASAFLEGVDQPVAPEPAIPASELQLPLVATVAADGAPSVDRHRNRVCR